MNELPQFMNFPLAPPSSPFPVESAWYYSCAPFRLLFCFHGKLLVSYVSDVAGGNSWSSWMYTSKVNKKCSKGFPSESKTKACMQPTCNSIYFPSMMVTDGSPVVEREFHAFSKFWLTKWTRKPFWSWWRFEKDLSSVCTHTLYTHVWYDGSCSPGLLGCETWLDTTVKPLTTLNN